MATEVELFNAAVVSALPHGMIVAHAGKTVPDGFLLCNGAAVSRKTYAKLFEAIGELWGSGDGSTTFNLPDSDGRVLQGATDASKVGKYLEAGLPNITGSAIRSGGGSNQFMGDASRQNLTVNGAIELVYANQNNISNESAAECCCGFKIDASKSNGIYSGETLQPKALQTLMIIKV